MLRYGLWYLEEITPQILIGNKVDVPNSVIFLNCTPIFEWYVIRCGSKNGCHEDRCLRKIRLRAQKTITILESIVNINGGGGST